MSKKKTNSSKLTLAILAIATLALGLVAVLTFKASPSRSKPKIGLRGAPESQVCKRAKASLELCVQRNQKMGIKACGSVLAEVTKSCSVRGR